MTVNISINDELMKKVDAYVQKNYLSRSGFFAILANQHFQTLEVTDCLKDIALSIRKVVESNELDEKTAKKLEEFERMAKFLNFKT